MLEGVANKPKPGRQELLDENDSHSFVSDSNDSRENNDKFSFLSNKELCAKLVFDEVGKILRGH